MTRCSISDRCGGCSLQHTGYEEELRQKKERVCSLLSLKSIDMMHKGPLHYRNRMDFVFHSKGLGLRSKTGWKRIVDVKDCLIADKRINSTLKALRELFPEPDFFDPIRQTGTLKYAVIRAAKEVSVSFVMNRDSPGYAICEERIRSIRDLAGNIIITRVSSSSHASVSDDYDIIRGSDILEEDLLGNRFRFHIQGFFQNNKGVAEMMHKHVRSILQSYPSGEGDLIDLYSGVGTFGINNSHLFKRTFMIEAHKGSALLAEENIRINKTKRCRSIASDSKGILSLDLNAPVVIADPPRAGMDSDTISAVRRKRPIAIIYISCSPLQLKKDIISLGYRLKDIALFDMFPRTEHIEAVAELVPG